MLNIQFHDVMTTLLKMMTSRVAGSIQKGLTLLAGGLVDDDDAGPEGLEGLLGLGVDVGAPENLTNDEKLSFL